MRSSKEHFFELTSDKILDTVESVLAGDLKGQRSTGRILALNSLENRVHEIELESGTKIISKFYRPGRWTKEQISEEHQFLHKLFAAEIPVVAPLHLKTGTSLAQSQEGIFLAIFPKVRGRLVDELSKTQLETLGRYLGRIHQMGKSFPLKYRLKMSTKIWGYDSLEFLMKSPYLEGDFKPHYERAVRAFLRIADEKLQGVPLQTVHGDCHLGNTLWEGESPFFLDFDDMMAAPAVQDIWMIVRGRDEEANEQRRILLSTYEQMCEFDWSQLSLIEVLRGLRIIHYSAWIGRRFDDPSFPSSFPSFGTAAYWRSEIEAIDEISRLIQGGEFAG